MYIEHDDGNCAPYAALVVGVGVVYPKPAFSGVPRQDAPATGRHRAFGEILDECFDGSVTGGKGIDHSGQTRIWRGFQPRKIVPCAAPERSGLPSKQQARGGNRRNCRPDL